jgi:hypothetical protein
MAIKGKGRTRGRRTVAAPPRPQLVIRKPPIWRRPVTWIVIGVLALGGILAGVFSSVHAHGVRRLKDRERAAVQAFAAELKAKFPSDSTFVPPDAYVFYPNLSADMDKLAKGDLSPADAVTEAKAVQDSAQKAASGVASLNVSNLISADFSVTGLTGPSTGAATPADIQAKGATQQVVLDAQFLMTQAFELWQQEGSVMEAAAGLQGDSQKSVIDQAKQLGSKASGLFDRGYRKILNIQSALGIQSPITPVTPFQRAPSPTPSVSPSPSSSKSPEAKASASPTPSASG